jgi:hypothetical protein
MYRLLVLTTVLGLSAIIVDAQAPAEQPKSPEEAVEQFFTLETEGKWLGPDHWDELKDVLTSVQPWFNPSPISVLKNYQVCDATKEIGAEGTVEYQVEVDFFEWGSIDYFLNFTDARGPGGKQSAAGGPVEQRTYHNVSLTDKYIARNPSGREEEKNGALRWSIDSFYSRSVNADAALRWVAEKRDKSNDPAIKYNAEKTIAILKSLSARGTLPSHIQAIANESPLHIFHRFLRKESVLLPDQWSQLTSFFAETPKPHWNKVHIVDVVGIGIDTNGNSTEVGVSTNSLGQLDVSLRLSNYPAWRMPPGDSGASACYGDDRFAFSLLLTDKHWQIATDRAPKEVDGPLGWRIEDTSFQPLITLNTAIRYVRESSKKTTDPGVKTNAARTLSILNYYKQGKPLPAELAPHTSSGCA